MGPRVRRIVYCNPDSVFAPRKVRLWVKLALVLSALAIGAGVGAII